VRESPVAADRGAEVPGMQDVELFLSLAEIAGVFVGFGALIAVRSGGAMTAPEVNDIRWVVSTAIWVVVVALAPVIISRYGITGHELWLVASLLALALYLLMIAVYGRTPENRAEIDYVRTTADIATTLLQVVAMFWLPTAGLVLALVIVVLGAFPNQQQALYLTGVGLGLFMSAMALLFVVFSQRRPQSASGSPAPRAERPPASGGADT
jgi:steroid 5-alpha reductase family enzyme